jgi:hypothetical protein
VISVVYHSRQKRMILVQESKPYVQHVRMLKRFLTMEERDGRRALASSDLVFSLGFIPL